MPSESTILEVRADEVERIARAFHESYERQAPAHGYETREASAVQWEKVPTANRQLMRSTVADLLARGVIAAPSPSETAEGRDWLADVREVLADAYTPEGVEVWLNAPLTGAQEPTPSNSKSGQTLGDGAQEETPAARRRVDDVLRHIATGRLYKVDDIGADDSVLMRCVYNPAGSGPYPPTRWLTADDVADANRWEFEGNDGDSPASETNGDNA